MRIWGRTECGSDVLCSFRGENVGSRVPQAMGGGRVSMPGYGGKNEVNFFVLAIVFQS